MKWSAELVALVPIGVVTVTSTVPAEPAGEVAVTEVLLIVPIVAALAPKWTAEVLARAKPVIVTTVPPAVVPLVGDTEVTLGATAAAASDEPRAIVPASNASEASATADRS